jgi:HEPN domain-containing protein
MKAKDNKFFDHAIEKLNDANKELYRPEEDMVSFLVCKNSQHAIENYLKGYLLQQGVEPGNYKTIDVLFEECKKFNKNFEKVDLSEFDCKAQSKDDISCNEISKVSNCLKIAESLDNFLRIEKIIV